MKNTTDIKQRRTFLNFFIVDPSRPIKSTATIPAADFLRKAMVHYVHTTLKTVMPANLTSYILSFVPGMWASSVEAKKFRQLAREAMKNEKSGWGWISWGR